MSRRWPFGYAPPDDTVPSTERRPALITPNDPQFWAELLNVLQDIRRNTTVSTKADGWETNGPTVNAIVGTATSRAILAITSFLQSGFYEIDVLLTNPEAGVFTYELAAIEGEMDPTSTLISDAAGSKASGKSQTIKVPGVSTVTFKGYMALRGQPRTRLALRILAPTTVVGHSGSLFLLSIR